MKKKTNETMKKEFSNSLREKDEDEDEKTKIKTINNSTEAIETINHYGKIINTQHKRAIHYIHKLGENLKMFKKIINFFYGTEQS